MVSRVDELDLGEHLSARGAPLADPADDRLGRLLSSDAQLLQRLELAEVEVARGEMPEEVADRADPKPLEELHGLAADAGQGLDLQVEAARAIPPRR